MKTVTGRTFRQIVNGQRFAFARTLIRGTQISIEEVAYRVNYQNRCKFELMYRKIFSVTPAQDRAALRRLEV